MSSTPHLHTISSRLHTVSVRQIRHEVDASCRHVALAAKTLQQHADAMSGKCKEARQAIGDGARRLSWRHLVEHPAHFSGTQSVAVVEVVDLEGYRQIWRGARQAVWETALQTLCPTHTCVGTRNCLGEH